MIQEAGDPVAELELLRRYVTHGETDAVRCLIQRYQGIVFATCLRRLGCQADAEDATQQVFVAMMERADKIRQNVGGWLYRCAVNTSASIIRSRQSRRRWERERMRLARDVHRDGQPDWKEGLDILDECLAELSCEDRDLLIRNHVLRAPQREIASSMGVTQQAVAKRIGKAMAHLRRKLQRRGVVVSVIAATALLTKKLASAGVPEGFRAVLAALPTSHAASAGSAGLAIAAKIKLGAAAAVIALSAAVVVEVSVARRPEARAGDSAPAAIAIPSPPSASAPEKGSRSLPLSYACADGPKAGLARPRPGLGPVDRSAPPMRPSAMGDRTTPGGMWAGGSHAAMPLPAQASPGAAVGQRTEDPALLVGVSSRASLPLAGRRDAFTTVEDANETDDGSAPEAFRSRRRRGALGTRGMDRVLPGEDGHWREPRAWIRRDQEGQPSLDASGALLSVARDAISRMALHAGSPPGRVGAWPDPAMIGRPVLATGLEDLSDPWVDVRPALPHQPRDLPRQDRPVRAIGEDGTAWGRVQGSLVESAAFPWIAARHQTVVLTGSEESAEGIAALGARYNAPGHAARLWHIAIDGTKTGDELWSMMCSPAEEPDPSPDVAFFLLSAESHVAPPGVPHPVPEPTGVALLLLSAAAVLPRRRRPR